jgi:hypothetical protein
MRLRITLISLLFAAMVQAQGIIDVHSHLNSYLANVGGGVMNVTL